MVFLKEVFSWLDMVSCRLDEYLNLSSALSVATASNLYVDVLDGDVPNVELDVLCDSLRVNDLSVRPKP